MYSPLSVSREWEVVMNECGVEDYSSVTRGWWWEQCVKNVIRKSDNFAEQLTGTLLRLSIKINAGRHGQT